MPRLLNHSTLAAACGIAGGAARLLALYVALFLSSPAFAQQWEQVTPNGVSPPARAFATAVYDSLDHRIVMFGGRDEERHLNDVWALNLDALEWTEITPLEGPEPLPRSTPAGAYDGHGEQMIIWSGQGNALFKDVWAFDLRTESWTELIPTTEAEPNDRYGVAAVYDPASRDLVTFAGFTSNGRFDDTWRFDIARSAWSEVLTGSDNPGRRCLHTAAYDAARHRMMVYGGQRTGPLGDIWAFDLSSNTWAELLPLTAPPSARYFVSTIYDEANDRMLMFGGNQGNQVLTDELWAFELSIESWQLLLPGGNGPSAREGSVAVYVPHENRMIVIGGRSTSYLNDVWALELRAASGAMPEDVPSDEIRLHANFPNPVAGSTAITYDLARPMSVDVTIYDLLGREVEVLARNMHAAGRHTITWDAGRLNPGIYFCRLTGGGAVHGRTLVIAERP